MMAANRDEERTPKIDPAQIIADYDMDKLTVGVLGSHSALDICRGAKDEGLPTLVVCERGRERTYAEHYRTGTLGPLHGGREVGVVDDVLVLDSFKDILTPEIQRELRERNVIFVPHRSFEVYLNDYDAIEQEFRVPIFGSRHLLRAEERGQDKASSGTVGFDQYDLLRQAGIRMPRIYSSASEIDGPCIVKLPEKERGFERAFFHCSTPEEYERTIREKLAAGEISEKGAKQAVIEEFVVGPLVNFNYFYSPLQKRLELLGTDTRRQTNMDGLLRLPAQQQSVAGVRPKFEEAGHMAVTVLESMLEKVFQMGESFIETAKKAAAPGVVGPFALQSAIIPGPPKKEIVVFDVSLRMPGSPGTRFTPYTGYLHGEAISAGRRVAMEIKAARDAGRLSEVLT